MRKYTVIIICLLLFIDRSTAQEPAYSGKEFKPLFGLTGLWKMDAKRGAIYEEWQVASDGRLAGRSYRLNNNDTMVLENVTISLQDNNIFYTPVVRDQNNQQPVPFKLVSCSGNRYVF